MKNSPQEHARKFLAPVRSGLQRGITAQMLAREATRIGGKPVAVSTVFRWLMNRGKPVEPKLGAGLVLKQAWRNLGGKERVSNAPDQGRRASDSKQP